MNSTNSHSYTRLPASHKHSPDMTRPDSITYYHLFKVSKMGKGQWLCPDSKAAERGFLPSVPHWAQHNASACSRYITSHQWLQHSHCVSYSMGNNTHPAASMTAGASLPILSPHLPLSVLAEHNMHEVMLLQLPQLQMKLYTKTPLSQSSSRYKALKVALKRLFLL